MTQKMIAALCVLLVCGSLAACGGQGEPSLVESAVSVSAAQEDSSQPPLKPEPRTEEAPSQSQDTDEAAQAREEAVVLTQQDSGAEAGYEPTFTLYPDGTFELFASFYDGSATITGTYVQQDGAYVLTPVETTAQGAMGSGLEKMTLTPAGENWTYVGEQLGITYDGAVFAMSQG